MHLTPEQQQWLKEREAATEPYFVTDPHTGEELRLWGYGVLPDMLDLDPRIDLTRPIWEQVQALETHSEQPDRVAG